MLGMMKMFSHRKSTNTNADQCAGKEKEIPAHIYQTHILTKLDAATLASAVSAFPQWLPLCEDNESWRKICNSMWPSTRIPRVHRSISAFPSAHRSFYMDSFPSASHRLPRLTCLSNTSYLISAVDFYYKDKVIYSKVLETETASDKFFENPLKLELLHQSVPMPEKYKGEECLCKLSLVEDLRVSWIVIDPYNKRAVNIASNKAVRCRFPSVFGSNEVKLHYATVAAVTTGELVQFSVKVTCGWRQRELHLKQVSMQIVGSRRWRRLNGRESMGILQVAMEADRRRRVDGKTEKANYIKFKIKKCCCLFF